MPCFQALLRTSGYAKAIRKIYVLVVKKYYIARKFSFVFNKVILLRKPF